MARAGTASETERWGDDPRLVALLGDQGAAGFRNLLQAAGGDPRWLHAARCAAAMRHSRAFDAYVRVCDTGEPWVQEVTYDTPFGDGYMLGDSRQLRRVLQNLVANAVKFRGEEPPRMEVAVERGSEEWIVTVQDNGVGVDPEHATRIFGMFSRGRTGADGMGIGLAVCRRVVEAHGGRIWVEAPPAGGSAFRFTLPR